MAMQGSQVSCRGGGGGGQGESFVKKSRNSSGWQMKSVHSSKAVLLQAASGAEPGSE